MLDWEQVTSAARTALTLEGDALGIYLESLEHDSETATAIRLLLKRAGAPRGFMVTSVEEGAEHPAELSEGMVVGVWRVCELLGAGGMGQVYRAERADGLYEQTVALKLMQSEGAARAERFDLERRRLASLEHPYISRIIDGGVTDDGRPYMAMEFVDGEPINTYVTTHSLSHPKLLRLFAGLCEAVGYAHNKLILHRDIKAPNVLVDEGGNVRLIDFGIASDLNDKEAAGGPLTLANAAPEQLFGEPLSVATDIHALGVLLYELLTGALPKRQADGSMLAAREAIANADLLAIVMRALALQPADRYGSAAALAADVGAVLDNRPVTARNAGLTYRVAKFLRRYPVGSFLAAAFVLALVIGMLTSLSFARKAQEEAIRTGEALALAQWQNNRAEASRKAQQAYSDVLQRSFGGDEDAEAMSEKLMSYWREAMEARSDDAVQAASLSYALGRNFYFRGDTLRALEVFDPWMKERFGPDGLLEIGEEVYALLLVDGSRLAEAEPLLRRLIKRYEAGLNPGKADLFNYAFKLARITRDRDDIDRAEQLVRELIENDTDPFEKLFHHNQLGFLRMAKGDRSGAYDAFKVTVAIMEENPNLAAFGRDIARLNLAGQELGFKRDLTAASALVEKILTEDVALKGEGTQKGRALLLKALIDHERENHGGAGRAVTEAVELMERFAGTGAGPHVGALCIQAVVLAGAGERQPALATLAKVEDLTKELPLEDDRLQKLAMAQIYVDVLIGSRDDVTERLDSADLMTSVRSDSVQYYLYQRLVDFGVASAAPNGP